jgi:hypothetical protein
LSSGTTLKPKFKSDPFAISMHPSGTRTPSGTTPAVKADEKTKPKLSIFLDGKAKPRD